MDALIIAGIGGGMFALAIALYKSASNSSNFSNLQKFILYISIIFPPLNYLLFIIFYFINISNNRIKPAVKQLKSSEKEIINYENIKISLAELQKSNLITADEYIEKKEKIDNDISKEFVLNTKEYENLLLLYKSKILNEEEFNAKTKLLIDSNKNNIQTQYHLIEKRYTIFGRLYSINDLKQEFERGNYPFNKHTIIEVDGVRSTMQNIEALEFFKKYFPPQ